MPALPDPKTDVRLFLRTLFDQAVEAADPMVHLPAMLPAPPDGRTLLVAVGKAAASMAQATERAWPPAAPLSGIALTRYGHGLPLKHIEVIEAGHPVPDDAGHAAAKRILADVEELGPNDMLLFLVSGGGSALLALPASGISVDEKKAINRALLKSGAPIGEMNCVRKHLSAVKGGRLAAAAFPARCMTYAISDVPGDDPSTIASGPTVPDPTSQNDAKEILARYGVDVSDAVVKRLTTVEAETPKQKDPLFDTTDFTMVAKPSNMLETVAALCRRDGLNVVSLGADLEGEARDVARVHADLALQYRKAGKSALILSGGETTVTIDVGSATCRGGRNAEYLLALAIALEGAGEIHALAADTDGIDGSEDNAGAIIAPDTLSRARSIGLEPRTMLDQHNAYTFFDGLDDLVTTGPTRTNVNDFRAIWVDCD